MQELPPKGSRKRQEKKLKKILIFQVILKSMIYLYIKGRYNESK